MRPIKSTMSEVLAARLSTCDSAECELFPLRSVMTFYLFYYGRAQFISSHARKELDAKVLYQFLSGHLSAKLSQLGQTLPTYSAPASTNVCSWSVSDHSRRQSELQRSAKNGLMHRSKQRLSSITSSARASSVGGILIPSALAVLRLMTSSNLVGCSTGKSAGLAPFNILSTNVAALRNNNEISTPYDKRAPGSPARPLVSKDSGTFVFDANSKTSFR